MTTDRRKFSLNEDRIECSFFAFGYASRLILDNTTGKGNEGIDIALAEIQRIEAKLSTTHPDSIICQLNANAGNGKAIAIDREADSLFKYVNALWQESNHVYDPTVSPYFQLYCDNAPIESFSEQQPEVQTLVGWDKVLSDGRKAQLTEAGMHLRLDDCARAYAADMVKRKLTAAGVTSALIDLDKDKTTIGRQPDGSNWLIGVRHTDATSLMAVTRYKANDCSFSIRGNFEETLWFQDEEFGYALSAIDGLPIPGLLSVAVFADTCLEAGSAASIARVKTEQAALGWLGGIGLSYLAIDRQRNYQQSMR